MATILIVEDDKQLAETLSDKLRLNGFKVLIAADGQIALDQVMKIPPDLILLDLVMPEMDGQTFYYNLRKTINKDIPVIILTNLQTTTLPEGVETLVKSDVSLDEIVKKIKVHLNMNE